MSHHIATINDRAAMAYQGETPWHQLGEQMTAETAANLDAVMAAASLDYRVSLEPMFLGNGHQVPGRQAVVRDGGAVLGTVSDWYRPLQNVDAFNIFRPAMDEFGLTVEAAGALGQGEKAWMLFKLPTDATPVPGDEVRGYGVAITGHNGSTATEFRPTPIRVVCQNTLNMAIGAGGRQGRVFSISHIGNVDRAATHAAEVVSQAMAAMQETGETFAQLAARRMTAEDVICYIEAVFPATADGTVSTPLERRRAEVADLVWSGVGAGLAGSDAHGTTAWAAYNAVAEYFDHVATGHAKTDTATANANRSALFGTGFDFKVAALRQAEQLVAA